MKKIFGLIAGLILVSTTAFAECVSDQEGFERLLNNSHFSTRWQEAPKRGNVPLLLSITEVNNRLSLQFEKTSGPDVGVWGSGEIRVCTTRGEDLEIISVSVAPGSGCPGMIRGIMRPGVRFNLEVVGANDILVTPRVFGGSELHFQARH